MWNGGWHQVFQCQLHVRDTEGGDSTTLQILAGIPLGHFPLEQSHDKTLKNAINQVTVIYGQRIQLDVALIPPLFLLLLKIDYLK